MAKRMFVDGKSTKFWEVWRVGSDVHIRSGKIGRTGHTTVKTEGTPEQAMKRCEKLVVEKKTKGYVETRSTATRLSDNAVNPIKGGSGPSKISAEVAVKLAAKIAKIESAARKAGIELPAGASQAAIAATEGKLGVTLPTEVRAFYLAHDGGPDNETVCGNRELLSLRGIVNQWEVWKEIFDDQDLEDDESSEPDPGVQKKWWIPEWIPVTYDLAGNHDVIDLAPAKGGKVGQIVSLWHDDGERTALGKDFLSWLQQQTWGD